MAEKLYGLKDGVRYELTEEEVNEFHTFQANVKLKSEANKYKYDRAVEYPSIQDQLDYIYHNSITKWKSDMIKPVKDAHPKP